MSDLASAFFAQKNPLFNILGQPTNVVNPNYPARTNVEYLGINGLVDTAAALATGVASFVPVAIDPGETVTKISVVVGATAASTPTHSWAALYAGTKVAAPPLIAQTADGTTAAIAASGRFDFTFTGTGANAPVLIDGVAHAPFGFVWVAICVTGTAVPSLATVDAGATAVQYAWFTNMLSGSTGPAGFSVTAGSALGATAATTIASPSKATAAPVVFLT